MTARFTAEELQALAEQARRRGDTLSSLVRDLVVETLDEVKRNLEETRRCRRNDSSSKRSFRSG